MLAVMNNLRRAALVSALALLVGAASPPAAEGPADVKRVPIGKNVVVEVRGETRRVVVRASVCLREGQLEGLLTRKGLKEHEYVLSADVDARHVHSALLACGAEAGTPVQFAPKYVPATGTVIKVYLEYQEDGKRGRVPAQQWARDARTKKDLAEDWVFAGSRLVRDPEDKDKPPEYLANHGDVICLCNMDTAMMDLPVRSPKKFEDRVFHAHTARIPAVGTAVDVVLEPVKPRKDPRK